VTDLSGSEDDLEWVHDAWRESARINVRARFGIPLDVPDEFLFDAAIEAMGGPTSESLAELYRQREARQKAELASGRQIARRRVLAFVVAVLLTGVGAMIARASHNDAAGVIVAVGSIVGAIVIFTKNGII